MSGNLGTHLSWTSPVSPQESFNKCKTHLAMIAFVLQDSPDRMLTSSQLMNRLIEFGSMRTKTFENNIRLCLSSNTCFVKVQMSPVDPRNNWRLDHSKITEKMVRRHLKGVLEWFPELSSIGRKEMMNKPPPPVHYTTLYSAVDSILKKDSPSGLCCKASPLSEESSVSVKVEQKSNWSTERTVGLKMKFTWDSSPAARPIKRMFTSPAQSNATQQELFNQCKSFLAMVAFILQDAPEKMLTFRQLMNRLESFGYVQTKSTENNIRVCLSTHTCFVKILLSPESPFNYWELDHSKITEKMVRRHFEGILGWFPELTSVRKEMMTTPPPSPDHYTTLHFPKDAACKAVNSRCEVKFSSSFSVESILKKDSPSGLCCKASPLSEECNVSVKVEQKPDWCTERTVGAKRKLNWDSSPVDTHVPDIQGLVAYCKLRLLNLE